MKKYSFLGLILVAASAVTAAMIPAKKDSLRVAPRVIPDDGNNIVTCTNVASADVANCDRTISGGGTYTGANPTPSEETTLYGASSVLTGTTQEF